MVRGFCFNHIFKFFSYSILYLHKNLYNYFLGGFMNNFDMQKLMSMLSQMDKKDLERGLAQASEILKNKELQDKQRNQQRPNGNCQKNRM